MMFRCCSINQGSHERSNVKLMQRWETDMVFKIYYSHEPQCIHLSHSSGITAAGDICMK